MAAEAAAAPPSKQVKIIAGADSFGCNLKDALISHLRSINIDVEDLGVSSYYSIAAEVGRRISTISSSTTSAPVETRGLVACGTGVGVGIFANKFPGVFAATCLTPGDAQNARSINNSNVLAVSGMFTSPDSAIAILDTWLSTPFKSPCPASEFKPWTEEIETFLNNSVPEMSKIGLESSKDFNIPDSNKNIEHELPKDSNIHESLENVEPELSKDSENPSSCAICCIAKNREFETIESIPGGSMKIVRESPTSAIVKFKAGSVEPAHHHTFGHDLVVMKGSKRVWNLTKNEKYDLGVGDYLFTPALDVHRVKYFEDTEFFIKWDGQWDMLFDEDIDAAKDAIEKELFASGSDIVAVEDAANEKDSVDALTPCDKDGSEVSIDYSSEFSTTEVFKSRDALMQWARDVGKRNGFVIVIKKSDAGGEGKRARVTFACERGGYYRSSKNKESSTQKRQRLSGTKKCGCPFTLKGHKLANDDDWAMEVVCGVHNHSATEHKGHSYAGRLSEEEASLLVELSRNSVKPKDILNTLKQRDAFNAATMKTIYNARQRYKVAEKVGKLQMQQQLLLE